MTWSKMAQGRAQGGLGRQNTDHPSFTPARQGTQSSVSASEEEEAPTRKRPERAESIPARAPDALIGLCLDEDTSMQALAEEGDRNVELGRLYHRASVRAGNSGSQSLSQAVLSIGLSEARILGFVQGTVASLPEALPTSEMESLLEGSLRRAVLAQKIAEEAGETEVWPAFAGGFTAELGLLYLAAERPHLSRALVSLSRHPGAERVNAERLMTGTDHGEAVADSPLGEALPDVLGDILRDHHHPNTNALGLYIAAADRVAELVSAPAPLERLQGAEQAVAVAGGRSDVSTLLRHTNSRVLALARLLLMTVGRQPDPNVLLQPTSAALGPAPVGDVLSLKSNGSGLSGKELLASLDNRSRLRDRIDQCCQERGEMFALLYLNFDQFRRINDTYGVPAGDQVMHTLAEGLQGCLNSPSDRLARIGGDSFAVFMPRTGDKLGQVTAERIRSLIEKNPVHLGGNTRIACSATLFGTSLSRDQARKVDGESVLLRMAAGLEEARQRSRNRISWG